MTTLTTSTGKPLSFQVPFTSRGTHMAARIGEKLEAAQDYLKITRGDSKPWHHVDKLEVSRLKIQKWLTENFLTYDFSSFPKYKKWGMTFAQPPMGALALFAFGGLAGWRALRGWQRGVIKDKDGNTVGRDAREVRDVMVRDIWAISVYLWALGALEKQFVKLASSKLGMALTYGGQSLSFSDIEDARTLHVLKDGKKEYTSKEAIQKLAANLLNGNDSNGFAKAAKNRRFFNIPRPVFNIAKKSPELMALLNTMAQDMNLYGEKMTLLDKYASGFLNNEETEFIKESQGKTPEEIKAIKEGRMAKRLDKFVSEFDNALRDSQTLLEEIEEKHKTGVANHDLIKNNSKLFKKLEKIWPDYAAYGARASKQMRVLWSDIPAFSTVLLLIGILPVQFNQWYTDKEYARLKDQTNRLRGFAYAMDNTASPLQGQSLLKTVHKADTNPFAMRA